MSSGLLTVSFVLLALAGGSVAGAAEPRGPARSEELRYVWRLEGLSGILSRLLGLLPTTGEAIMALRPESADRLAVEFTATSEKADADEFWKYETVVDPVEWRSLSVIETLNYKKKQKRKSFELEEHEVIDVLAGLQLLRFSPPADSDQRNLWSDGKVYTVEVTSNGFERREYDGQTLTVRHLSIRGVREPKRHVWRSRADIWLTDDSAALPLEIIYHQALGQLRMTLVEPAGGG